MTGNEWKAFRDILFGRALSNHSKTVGMYFLSYRNPKTYLCCPSMDRVSRDMGLSRRQVQDSVNELVASGVLTKRLVRGHNEYTFVACPPPGTYADVEDATKDELREIVDDAQVRAIGRVRCKTDNRFNDDIFPGYEAVKWEYYAAEVNGNWPAEYAYAPGDHVAVCYPF